MSGRRSAIVIGAVIGALSGWIAVRVFLRAVRTGLRIARYAFAVITLRLYRRCPDCKALHRADARVCRYCGYRKPQRTGRRGRREARRQSAAA